MEKVVLNQTLVVLDLEPLTAAFGEWGDGARDMLEFFLQSVRPLLDGVAAALNAGDARQVIENAHAAKGSANVTGANRLGDLCGRVERSMVSGDFEATGALARHLPAALAELEAEIARMKADA